MRLEKKSSKLDSNEMEYKFILTGLEADDLYYIMWEYLRICDEKYTKEHEHYQMSRKRELANAIIIAHLES